jgi:acyl-CoA thioester hydrolase
MSDTEEFPYVTEVDVRFRDLDPMDHVNNAIYVTYIEQARAEYYEDVIGLTLGEADTVLAHLEVDYHRPIELGEVVEVRMRTEELGESSIPMAYELRVDGDLAATAETIQVTFDRETGESVPLPAEWRERIGAFERESRAE